MESSGLLSLAFTTPVSILDKYGAMVYHRVCPAISWSPKILVGAINIRVKFLQIAGRLVEIIYITLAFSLSGAELWELGLPIDDTSIQEEVASFLIPKIRRFCFVEVDLIPA